MGRTTDPGFGPVVMFGLGAWTDTQEQDRMGKYDDITPEELRSRLVRFARLILKLEERGTVLDRGPALLKLLGELRQMLFAYEVRYTGKLRPREGAEGDGEGVGEDLDEDLSDSLRIVQEALEREQELQDELRDRLFPEDDD